MLRYRYSHLRDNMVGSWCPSLGVTGPLLLDRSGRNNHGVLTNMDPGTDWVASAGGNRSGLALDLDGTNDYIDCGTNFGAPLEITVSAWVNFRAFKAYTAINCKQAVGGGFGWSFMVKSNGKLALYVTASSNRSYDGTGAFTATTNAWNHYAFTVTNWTAAAAGAISGYFNGFYDGGGATNGPLNMGSGPLTYGVDLGSAGRNADALFDSMAIWNRALSSSELRELSRYRGIEHEVYRVPIVRGATVSGGITGTLAATEENDTLASSATIAIAAVLSATEASDTVSSASTIAIAATAGITEAGDILSSASAIAIAATLTLTEASDTCVGSSTIGGSPISGQATVVEQDDTVSSDARVAIAAAAGITEASDTVVAASTLLIKAVAAITEAGDTLSASSTSGGSVVQLDTNPFAITDLTTTWAW